jgi:hypothetical protein
MDWRVNAAGEPAGGPDASKWLVALDGDNQVVWYYAVQRKQRPQAVERLPNGNFVYLTRYQGFEEITPDARSVRWMPAKRPNDSGPHHDFTVLPDGRILYLGAEDRTIDDRTVSGKSKLLVRGDTLDVLDPASGTVERVWGTFDAFDPADRPQHWAQIAEDDPDVFDWTHANTVMIGPRGNLIVSIRHLDQIISLAPDFKTIEWKLGGFGSSFSFADPSDRFYGQHDVSELPGGRILMFDNGNYRPEGEYSRGLELQLDFETMTAHKVWEYRQQPDVFSSQLGSAVRLSNGETILNFGFRDEDPKAPVILAEARPDGSAAWEQSLTLAGLRASRYRTLPLDSLAGELPVEPTALR